MELEEAIKILRKCNELIYSWNLKEKCDLNEAIEKVLQALEKLQQDNYKLDRENQQLFESKINSIPKKKIEDKIEAYKKLIEDISESDRYSHEIPLYKHDIQVIQELLER